jgi:hypothetical protein
MKKSAVVFAFLALTGILQAQSFDPLAELGKYNVRWDSPSDNSLGSMPLGNGDIGINVWMEKSGDLLFYISKTDAWSENAQLLKLGKVRIKLTPNPFAAGSPFSQELLLEKGEIRVNGGVPQQSAEIILRVDARHPLIQVSVVTDKPTKAEVIMEPWRKEPRPMINPEELNSVYGLRSTEKDPVIVQPDTFLPAEGNRLLWYHRNIKSVWAENLTLQALGDMTTKLPDPLLGRIFGAAVEGSGMSASSNLSLSSIKPSKKHAISVYALTTTGNTEQQWKSQLEKKIAESNAVKESQRISDHYRWWADFWKRSYIFLSANEPNAAKEADNVTRGYVLQRFINACGGRGGSPIKFNGTIFTVDTYDRSSRKGFDADFRLWGGSYWFQNTRLPYWSMLASGDFEMLSPLFKMYMDALPLRKAATKKYYNHSGAFYPETMLFWGTYNNGNYGYDRQGWPDGLTHNTYIRYHWNGGLELTQMMLDYYMMTGSREFAKDTLLPFAREILTFFGEHWPMDIEGKILFVPSQALETYQTTVDPTPDIAGLKEVTKQMLSLPEDLVPAEFRAYIIKLTEALPEIPLRHTQAGMLIAPARNSAQNANIENPELYAVWPFRVYGLNKPELDLAVRTFHNRKYTFNIGWQHSAVQAAYLGLTDEAAAMVLDKFSHSDPECRFPAFWGPNYDWSPDQDHGCVGMIALQRMILPSEGQNITTLPAWPEKWNVEFRLAGPSGKIVEGSFSNGKIIRINTF